MDKKCEGCNNLVTSSTKTVRFCSRSCARKNAPRIRSGPRASVRITKKCPSCLNSFITRWERQICCSRTCARKLDAVNNGGHSHSYKGGTCKHSSGYVKGLARDHPLADKEGYVMQHRLVMERHLGRQLEVSERVHHKNGIRNDNRIENLELWVGAKDPPGVRAIDKARDILSKLSPDELALIKNEL